MKKLENITENDIKQKGVQALANRPNTPAKYGIGGLTPEGLKRHFDQLASFLAEKINDLQDALSGDEAPSHIRLPLFDTKDAEGKTVEGKEGSLADLVASFASGVFASTYLHLLPSESSESREPLQTIISKIAQSISTLKDDSGASLGITVDSSTHEAKISLYNKAGASLAEQTINLKTSNERLATDAVTTGKIMDGNVTDTKLADGAVKEAKLDTDAVTTGKIMDGNVTESKLATDAVTTGKIMDGNVTDAKLADGAVKEAKLDTDAVTTGKIMDGNVTESKLATDAVTTSKIMNENVTADKLATDAVTTGKIKNGAVTDDKISSEALGGVIEGIEYVEENFKLIFKMRNGTTKTIDLPLESTVSKAKLDEAKDTLVLTFTDGSVVDIPLANLTTSLKESIKVATELAEKATERASTAAASATDAAENANAEAAKATDAAAEAEQFVSEAKETMDAAIDEFTSYQVVKTIDGGVIRFYIGTEKYYKEEVDDALKADTVCLFTDDKTLEEIEAEIEMIGGTLQTLQDENIVQDDFAVGLKNRLDAHDDAIESAHTRLNAHDDAIAEVKYQSETRDILQDNEIVALQEAVGDLKKKDEGHDAAIAALQKKTYAAISTMQNGTSSIVLDPGLHMVTLKVQNINRTHAYILWVTGDGLDTAKSSASPMHISSDSASTDRVSYLSYFNKKLELYLINSNGSVTKYDDGDVFNVFDFKLG